MHYIRIRMTKEILYFIHNKDVAFHVRFLTQKQEKSTCQ